jgi:hypothetical protein
VVDEFSDAHVVAIQTILDFLGDYGEEDISFLLLEEYFLLHNEKHKYYFA